MSDVLEPIPEEDLITLIVENGTCVPDANSYISLLDAEAYQKSRNRLDWLALSDNEKAASLIKATQYIDATYIWKGREKFILKQPLRFPRVMIEIDGYEVTGIPKCLKDAICEAAYYGFQQDLFTVHESEQGIVKKDRSRVEGAVEKEIEYFSNSEKEVDFVSKYAVLDSLLRGLYIPKGRKPSINGKARWDY